MKPLNPMDLRRAINRLVPAPPEYGARPPVHFPVVSAIGHGGEPIGATASLVSTKAIRCAR